MCINKQKFNSRSIRWVISLLNALLLSSCLRSTEVVEPQLFEKPPHFPEPTYTFGNNPLTEQGNVLGKKLFFDPRLSADGEVSCNTCHQQGLAFADSQQHPFSIGIDGKSGKRNAPSLANLAFFPEFFWDGGVTHLDFVPINAIESPVELGITVEEYVRKLNAIPEYKPAFELAFGTDSITLPFALQALSQFTATMVSAGSAYDKHVLGQEQLSADELQGKEIFDAKCSSCHSGELFTDFSYRNNGQAINPNDLGRATISEHESDNGKFRVPSLRNVALTAPYMHNARFWSLREVLDHYSSGVVASATLASELQQGEQLGIALSENEKELLELFLHTLTDHSFRSDEKFRP